MRTPPTSGWTHGKAHFYQFESPLLRLLIDYEYKLMVNGNQQRLLQDAKSNTLPQNPSDAAAPVQVTPATVPVVAVPDG